VIDSHAHLGLCEPDDAELVAAAAEAGVTRILTVGLGDDSNPAAIETAAKHDGVWAAVGCHPNSAGEYDDGAAERLRAAAEHPSVAAIGETGLDFYRESATRAEQERAFRSQIEIAREVRKPLVIHVRDTDQGGVDGEAIAGAFELLDAEASGVGVILHCFSATQARAEAAAERGWYCSFAGNVTFPKSSELREAARVVPDELVLVETDSPFLAPQPVRGKANQPANVVATAEVVAAERSVSYEELEALVDANAERVFGW
jgi:TatD DNase family protein